MRIGMICSAPFPPCEGIGYYVWNLSKNLVKQGHEVQLITRGNANPTRCDVVDGIKIWRVTFLPVYPYHVHFHNIFVNRLIYSIEPQLDLLHLHSPLVSLPSTKLPSLTTVHSATKGGNASIPADDWFGRLVKLQAPFSFRIEKKLFSKTDKLVTTAIKVTKELSDYGVDSRRVAVLANGVDTSIFYPNENSTKIKSPYLLTVGRLVPAKGIEDLIKCAQLVLQKMPELRFFIVGSGQLEESLKENVKSIGLTEKIIFLGQVIDRHELANLYRQAIAYIHPSHKEGLPTVVLEAMACARPVIATSVGGVPDIIQDGHNGFLVLPRNPSRMADAILKLLSEPEIAAKMGEEAFQTIRRFYTWEIVSTNYLAQYQALVENVSQKSRKSVQ